MKAHVTPRSSSLFLRERGAGQPLVLLHGLASSSRYWGDLRPLADAYRVLAPDLLGFGRSPKPRDGRYGPEEHVGALRQALRQRLDRPFHLLGHSLGSLLALHYAVTHPESVRSLVLISLPVVGDCAWGHRTDGRMSPWHRLCVHTRPGNVIFSLGMRAAAPLWNRVGPRLRPGVPPDATRDALAATWTSYWRTLEEVVYRTDAPSLIARLRVPVMLIHGPNDLVTPISPVRALAAERSLRLVEILEAGHNPCFTHPAATVEAICAFLHDVDGARGRGSMTTPLAAEG
jgi:cis-3-alkyl-4-acyloxetan-2-one decarboxylase